MSHHEIKACLIKYSTPLFNDMIILPEAFEDCEGSKIPIIQRLDDGVCNGKVLGFADLHNTDKGVECTGTIIDNEDVNRLIEKVRTGRLRLGIYANEIKKQDNLVTHGRIRAAGFVEPCDEAACIYEIDGVDI